MKLKAIIRGGKVHEVGYRFFLFTKALEFGSQGFFARNQSDGRMQLVLTLIEGDQQPLAEFKEFVQAAKPEGSNVEDIAFEDYGGSIMSTDTFMHYFTADLLNKRDICPAAPASRTRCWKSRTGCSKSRMKLLPNWKRSDQTLVLEIKTSWEDVVAKLNENREAIVGEMGEKKERLDERIKRIDSDVFLLKSKVGI